MINNKKTSGIFYEILGRHNCNEIKNAMRLFVFWKKQK